MLLVLLANSTIAFSLSSPVINYALDPNRNDRQASDLLFITSYSYVFTITMDNVWYFGVFETVYSLLVGMWTVSYDMLYFGFLLELCSQFDILAYRLKSLSSDEHKTVLEQKIKQHLQHHDHLYR